jgi:ABC-type histidine transport system ATPase subunit
LEWGPPEQILNKPQKKETQQFLKQVNEAGRL